MMDPVVVTGVPGWLGTRLVQALFEGLVDGPAGLGDPQRRVSVLVFGADDVPALAGRWPGLRWVRGDLNDAASLDALFEGSPGATVYHCAGLIHPALRTADLARVNVDGTRALIAAAERHGARRFVHVSSNSPIGCNPEPSHRFDESAPYRPYYAYGATKMQAEQLVLAARDRGALETVIVRPPWFYGPNQPERQSTFFSMILNGRGPLVGDGSNQRSMVYVDNLCHGVILAGTVPAAAGQTYWIADERPYPMTEILDTIERSLEEDHGYRPRHARLRLPWFVGQLAEWVDAALQAVGLYHQKFHVLGEMNKNIACSIDKARRELGYSPRIALREGMRRSIADLHERGIRLS